MPEPKFNPKNLSYDSSLPPFLARLHGQHSSAQREGGPDPTLAARRRPGVKKRSASEEAEDAPLVVDERGNVVSAGFLDGGDGDEVAVVGVGDGKEGEGPEGLAGSGKKSEQKLEGEGKQEKVAGIGGAAKKRKVGRVVVNDDADDDDDKHHNNDNASGREKSVDKKKPTATGNKTTSTHKTSTTTTTATATTNTAAKPKQKAKKIKLSFGDDEEAG